MRAERSAASAIDWPSKQPGKAIEESAANLDVALGYQTPVTRRFIQGKSIFVGWV